jgi:pimeloyl-ACP methyl ester carboxylesterase
MDFIAIDFETANHLRSSACSIGIAVVKNSEIVETIKGLIPLSPAWMIPEIARKGELLGEHFDPDHIPEKLHGWHDLDLDGNYARVAQTIHVEEAIDRYRGPVLIVHGDEDETVPVEYGIRAAERYNNAKLVLIEGDDHCYDRHLDQVVAAVQDWLRQR